MEIKTNILEMTMQHGVFEQRRSIADTHSIVKVGILTFGGAGESGRVKLTTHHQKETWLHCVHFALSKSH